MSVNLRKIIVGRFLGFKTLLTQLYCLVEFINAVEDVMQANFIE